MDDMGATNGYYWELIGEIMLPIAVVSIIIYGVIHFKKNVDPLWKYLLKITSAIALLFLFALVAITLMLDAGGIGKVFDIELGNRQLTLGKGKVLFSFEQSRYFIFALQFCLITILGWILVKTSRFMYLFKQFFACLIDNIGATYQLVKVSNVKYLLLVPLCLYVYFAFTMPITHDEAFTYVHFLKPSLWVGMVYYPAPNNHILYSILGSIAELFHFLDLRFAIRLPATIISIIALLVVYRFVHKLYADKVACIVVAFTSIGTMYVLYSTMARGYGLLVLFVIVCLYMAFNIIAEGNRAKHWSIFALSGILGFYTMPTFLYPFVGINLFILCYNYKKIGMQICYNLLVVAFTFVLYSPIIIVSGLDSLIGNPFVVAIERITVIHRLPGFVIGTLTELFGAPFYIIVPILAGVIIYTIVKKQWQLLLLWCVFCILPLVLMVVQSVVPFFRSFVYLTPIILFLSFAPFGEQIKRISTKILLPTLLIVQLLGSALFATKSSFYSMYFASYHHVIEASLEDGKSYFIICGLIQPNIAFEADHRGYHCTFVGGRTNKVDTDTIKGYDYCIIDSVADATKTRLPLITVPGFENRPVNIYKKE